MADVATASHISIFFSFLFGLCLQIALCSENVPDCLKLNYALMNDYMSAERSVAKGCIPSVHETGLLTVFTHIRKQLEYGIWTTDKILILYMTCVAFNEDTSISFPRLAVNGSNGDPDFTYSAADLYRLTQTEQRFSKVIKEISTAVDDFKEDVASVLFTEMTAIHSDEIIKNPLLSYQLVKRHAVELTVFQKSLEAFTSKMHEFMTAFVKARTPFTSPKETDLFHAMEAIIRLRQTYNLSAIELSDGRLGKIGITGSLSAEDLILIGKYGGRSKMKNNAKIFLESGLHKAKRSTDISESWLADARQTLDNIIGEQAGGTANDREDSRILTEMDEMFATDSLENLNNAFENLCQQYAVKDPPVSNLRCYLETKPHPIYQLFPLKVEVHHEDPQVVVIYDFMSAKECRAMEDATFYSLKRSETQFYLGDSLHSEPSIIRTTSQTWLDDRNHPTFGYIGKRIESITGYYLSGENSVELMQVASYRPGGHYSLHTDATHEEVLKEFLTPLDILQGDRIATFMVYLTDVEMGGNTVFPVLNVSVRPIKGSAILWGNLFPDGNIARDTLHGACPVVYGIKNIATKWIRANDQMFTRQNCKPDKTSDHFQLSK